MKILKFQRIQCIMPFFARWAKITTPFSGEKHYLENNAIVYDVKEGVSYANHIEMAGFYSSAIISYGVDKNGKLRMKRHIIFPTLRCYPNKTHSSLHSNYKGLSLMADGKKINDTPYKFVFDGIIKIFSKCGDLNIERNILPASTVKACIEKLHITNNGQNKVVLTVSSGDKDKITSPRIGVDFRKYKIFVQCDKKTVTIDPGKSVDISGAYCGANETENYVVDTEKEYKLRMDFISKITQKVVINTPSTHINMMTYYAKIRAAESIFMTKVGLMHSPGGGGYYAALWTNDQCEYVNPFFGYLGYKEGIDESINCYNLYKKYIFPDKALITSIIAEGDGIWHGAKDRGDSAMYAYGCSRFLLTLGDKKIAKDFIKYIEDCLTFTISQKTKDGIIASDSDELENRFESGSANLCTSCLAYDALLSASYIERDLGNAEKSELYSKEAKGLRNSIEKYFGKNVEGYDTYRYCEEEGKLRSWIAMPLVVGIFDRAEQTANALLSPKLRMNDGLLTRSGGKTFWDRSTLYTLRGLFNAGLTEKAIELLETYSTARLLGEHIPYAVEAFPEGNQAQLSAESGLYVRIIIEGILGFRPIGFGKFELKPRLPKKWNNVEIKNMFINNKSVNISVTTSGANVEIKVNGESKIAPLSVPCEFQI